MISHVVIENNHEYYCAENQEWDYKTLQQLRKKYDIVFRVGGDGVVPIKLIKRKNSWPLIAFGIEDDGTISFSKHDGKYDFCISAFWIPSLVGDLKRVFEVSKKWAPNR